MDIRITTNGSDEDLAKQNGELTSHTLNGNVSILTSQNETLRSCNANKSSKNLETSHATPMLFFNIEAVKSFGIPKDHIHLKRRKNNEQLDNDLKDDNHGFHKTEQQNYHPSKMKELIK